LAIVILLAIVFLAAVCGSKRLSAARITDCSRAAAQSSCHRGQLLSRSSQGNGRRYWRSCRHRPQRARAIGSQHLTSRIFRDDAVLYGGAAQYDGHVLKQFCNWRHAQQIKTSKTIAANAADTITSPCPVALPPKLAQDGASR
jgi:hypothetical protein